MDPRRGRSDGPQTAATLFLTPALLAIRTFTFYDLSTPRALFWGAKNRGGARIANHCDAGAGERFLKAFPFPRLPSGSRGKETVRCDAGLSSSVHSPWGDVPTSFQTCAPS